MDYEQKYKEALEWMRSVYPALSGADKEDAEHFFPELAESEDERIRKWIVNFIEVRLPDAEEFEPEYRAALAYLEKQKEQEAITDSQKYNEGYEAGLDDGYNKGYWKGYDKAMEDHKNSVCYNQDWPQKMPEIPTYTTTSDSSNHPELKVEQKEQKPIIAVDSDLLLKILPKPAEWSEEDENWLKSLRPQPKAELTLLDENIIKAAVAFIEQNDHFNCWRGIDKHTVIKALRSLKPHWKPSDEQIRPLEYAIEYFKKKKNDTTYLESLLNDLNKL